MSGGSSWVVDPVTQEEIWVPPSCSGDEAIRRAARLRDGELAVVRMFPEHTVRWPLWVPGEGPVAPTTLGVSTGLSERLAAWNAAWERRAVSAWTPDEEAQWLAEGDELAAQLQAELWESAEVRVEYRPK